MGLFNKIKKLIVERLEAGNIETNGLRVNGHLAINGKEYAEQTITYTDKNGNPHTITVLTGRDE